MKLNYHSVIIDLTDAEEREIEAAFKERCEEPGAFETHRDAVKFFNNEDNFWAFANEYVENTWLPKYKAKLKLQREMREDNHE